jgi:hypothetical protein
MRDGPVGQVPPDVHNRTRHRSRCVLTSRDAPRRRDDPLPTKQSLPRADGKLLKSMSAN